MDKTQKMQKILSSKKMPVSERAVYQRVNRKLRPQGQQLKAPRRPDPSIGRYYVLDVDRNALLWFQVDLENYARELGVLAEWERMVQ
jgi:hypothetical protein